MIVSALGSPSGPSVSLSESVVCTSEPGNRKDKRISEEGKFATELAYESFSFTCFVCSVDTFNTNFQTVRLALYFSKIIVEGGTFELFTPPHLGLVTFRLKNVRSHCPFPWILRFHCSTRTATTNVCVRQSTKIVVSTWFPPRWLSLLLRGFGMR